MPLEEGQAIPGPIRDHREVVDAVPIGEETPLALLDAGCKVAAEAGPILPVVAIVGTYATSAQDRIASGSSRSTCQAASGRRRISAFRGSDMSALMAYPIFCASHHRSTAVS